MLTLNVKKGSNKIAAVSGLTADSFPSLLFILASNVGMVTSIEAIGIHISW